MIMLGLSLSARRCAHAKGEPRIVIVFANRSFSSWPPTDREKFHALSPHWVSRSQKLLSTTPQLF